MQAGTCAAETNCLARGDPDGSEHLGGDMFDLGIQTDDESLGRRRYLVNRQRAVERSLERWRRGLKADWHLLSRDDIGNLAYIAGELWASVTRDQWEQMHFSKLGLDETRRIAAHADRLRHHGAGRSETIAAVMRIIEEARVRADSALLRGETVEA